MRVAMYYNNSNVRVEEIPRPDAGADEFIMRVEACGICGSDVMEWYRVKSAPRVLGHEATGEVIEVGSKVTRVKKGDRVFVSHHVPCGNCHFCDNGKQNVCQTLRTTNFYPGGFSELVRVPKINVELGTFVLPSNMSYEEGTLIEPLACVLRGQRKANLVEGERVLVIGSGISGLLHIKLARAMDAGFVAATDISEFRLQKAREFGADIALGADSDVPGEFKKATNGMLADLVIVCAGVPAAFEQAFKSVERGGTVLVFAPTTPDVTVPVPVWNFWRDGINVVTTYAAAPEDIVAAIELMRSGCLTIGDMITHSLPLAEAQKGFNLTAKPQDSLKVVIRPNA